MSKRIRFTALLLAVSLFLNTASLPVTAEGALDSTLFTQEESVPTTAETQYTTAPQEAVTEAATETTAAAASEAPTEAPTEATTEVTTEATTEATEGTIEATTEATEETTEATTGENEETTEATDATEETTEATTEAPQEPIRGKVVCTTSVNIRSGPGTGYEILGSAYNEDVVYVYEIAHMEDADWGRIGEGRWICLTYVILEGTDPTEGTEATEATEATQATEETTEATTEATEPTEESKETEATETTESTDATETAESTEATDATELPELEAEPSLLNLDATTPDFEKARTQTIIPGEMDLVWWAAVCGKENSITAWVDRNTPVSALAEEPVDAAPAEEETDPTEESTVPGTEETTVPVTEETTIPASEETTVPVTEETTVPVTEAATVPVTEAATVPETTAASADIQSLSDAEVVAFSETENITTTTDTRNLIPANRTLEILDAKDLICLSYVNPEYYQDLILDIGVTGNSVDIKVSSDQPYTFSRTDESGNPIVETLYFQGLGGVDAPFQGTVEINATALSTTISLDKPLFVEVDTCAAICSNEKPLNLKYTKAEEGKAYDEPSKRPNALLAEGVVSHPDENSNPITKPWYLSLSTTQEGESIPGLLPLIDTLKSSSSASIVFKGEVLVVTENQNKLAPVVTGSGFLCNTMEDGTSLTFSGISSIPEVQNTTSSAGTGGLVGTMGAGSKLTLPALTLGAVSSSSGDVGGLVGCMGEGALLTSSAAITLGAVIATDGHAGGLVGKMEAGAQLNFTNSNGLTLNNVTADGTDKYAGGLAGKATNPTFNALPQITAVQGAIIKGNDAGGLVGWMEVFSSSEQPKTFELAQQLTGLTVEGEYSSGGLFGILCNMGGSYTISGITSDVKFSRDSTKTTNAGGLIGAYTTSSLENALILTGNTTTSTLTNAINNYGGLIGRVWNTDSAPYANQPAYIQINGTTRVTTTESAAPTNYGGLIASLDDVGNMVHVAGNVSVNSTTGNFTGSGSIGGIVGSMPAGVLRLETAPDLTQAVPSATGTSTKTRGWILGKRGETLVYTDASDWDHNKSDTVTDSNTNDTGVWGQVLRVGGKSPLKVEATSEEEGGATAVPLLDFDETAHTVTVRAVQTQGGKILVDNEVDFAALALRLQLDEKTVSSISGALRFKDGDLSGNSVSIVLNSNINLENTGLTCLTKDYYTSNGYFSFDIAGNNYSITLPSIMVYAAADSNANGSHDRQGLIGQSGTLTVDKLTLKTTGKTLQNDEITGCRVKVILSNQDPYVGMLAAEVNDTVTLTNFTSSVKLTISSIVRTKAKISGIIGAVTDGNKDITFTSCTWDGSIRDTCQDNTYDGGFLSMIMKGGSRTVTAEGCKVLGSIYRNGSNFTDANNEYVPVGAFICTLYYGTTKLIIDGLTVDGASVEVAGDADYCGGLLSFEWGKVDATVTNVTITNSKLTVRENCWFGGLVYKASGKIQLGDGTNPGITFNTGNMIEGTSTAEKPAGLLIGRGDYLDSEMQGLYLIVKEGGYVISDPGNVTVNICGSDYFDELVGKTINVNGNGIVSIETTDGSGIDQNSTCNTYLPQLGRQYENTQTRYYYNLSRFTAATNTVDSAEALVMLSAGKHCHSSLRGNFLNPDKNNSNYTITRTINLAGYSYYPIPVDGSVSVNGATISFDYKTLETVEGSGYQNAENANAENKCPSNSQRQHYQLHFGIFEKAENTSSDTPLTLNVTNLTLRGTVGGSAIICGEAKGNGASAMTQIIISGVNLAGICRYPAPTDDGTIAPLLINTIGNYSSMTMSGVKTVKQIVSTESGDIVYSYDEMISKGEYAASSLIGNVGNSTDGKYIYLTFAQMGLNGKTADNSDKASLYDTERSIFCSSLFLNSFRYTENSTCSGTYNFESTEPDYTMGKELSNSDSGRNMGLQYWFFNRPPAIYVYNKNENGNDTDAAAFFSNGYLRYVKVPEGTETTSTEHEIDINLVSPDLLEGCGTYSHPFLIRNGDQLMAIAGVLNGGTRNRWKINMNPVVLDGNFASLNSGHVEGDANTGDKVYTCVNSTTWEATDGTSTTNTKVLTYLRNAYYVLAGPTEEEINAGAGKSITLSASVWTGLGSSAPTGAFSGVIKGEKDVPLVIKFSGTSQQQFGGLIKFSQGSVVKDITIEYPDAPKITGDAVPSDADSARFFGGVVGWCIGGDTIIDNVTVNYNGDVPVITGDKAHLAAIGGYVGLVGGYSPGNTGEEQYGGGVVFRNMNSNSHPGLTVPAGKENFFYFNPYVGRVLDGYAMGDGIQLDNTNKNYFIPNILKGDHLIFSERENKVTVNDSQGLWLLSAIANSGAWYPASSSAYTYGKARTCDYNGIGSTLDNPSLVLADEYYTGGSNTSYNNLTYLSSGAFSTGDSLGTTQYSTAICIELKAGVKLFDMDTGFKNGFRGIGTSYGANTSNGQNGRLIRLQSFDGNGATIKLAQNRQENTEEMDNWTTIGTGLFTQLCILDKGSLTLQDLILSGSTGISYYASKSPASASAKPLSSIGKKSGNTANSSSTRLSQVGAGMLAGNFAKNGTISALTLTGIHLENATVNNSESAGTTFAGGLIGLVWNNGTITNLTINDCKYTSLSVTGRLMAGGLIGYTQVSKISIEFSTDTTLSDGEIRSKFAKDNFDAIGGLIGFCFQGELTINASPNITLTLKDLSLVATSNNKENTVGGLVGTWYAKRQRTCRVNNVQMEGDIQLTGSESGKSQANMGLIAGFMTDDGSTHINGSEKAYNMVVTNFKVAQDSNSKVTICKGRRIGGLFGMYITPNSDEYGDLTLRNIQIGSANGSVLFYNDSSAEGECLISGLIAMSYASPHIYIDSFHLNNVAMLSKLHTAAMVAQISKSSDNPVFQMDLRNVSMENCIIATNNTSSGNAGLLYGLIKNESGPAYYQMTGINIMVRNCQMGYEINSLVSVSNSSSLVIGLRVGNTNYSYATLASDSSLMMQTTDDVGLFGGKISSEKPPVHLVVHLVGVSLWNNGTPAKDFGNNPEDNYVIRADYLADTSGSTGSYPRVTTSPEKEFPGIEKNGLTGILTGDGVAFVKDKDGKETATSIAQKILGDYNGTSTPAVPQNQVHFSVPEAMSFLDASTLSDFNTAGENGTNYTGPNFPVLLISENTTDAINNLVAAYISVMTNHVEYSVETKDNQKVFKYNYSDLFSITPTTYKWDSADQKFKEAAAGTHTLTFSNGKLSINKGRYDNQLNQFTLLDVAYYDPADSTKNTVAYHLYIPVVVKKVLLFKVWFSAKEGTDYYTSIYDSQEYAAMASHGDQVTTLITFEYEWNTDEWENALNNGAGLNWNFPKTLQIKDVNSGGIPSGTKLTLVDRNNQNKAYFTPSVGISPDEDDYISFKLQDQFAGFSEVKLWELLTLNAIESKEGKEGQYVKVDVPTSDTIQIGDKYYRPITEDEKAQETPPTCYYLEVKGFKSGTTYAREQYYLTIQTPKTSSEFVYLILQHKSRLDNPNGNGLPSDRIAATDDPKTATPLGENTSHIGVYKNVEENMILISNFFKQELTVRTTSSEQLMSDTNRSITGTLKTVISFNSVTDKRNYLRYTQGRSLHQCFELYLKSMNNGTGTTVSFDEGASLTVGGKAVPLNGGTRVQVYSEAIKWDESSNSKTVSCDFTLTYTLAGISSQFPIRVNDTDKIGIQVNATSKLSCVEDMSQTSMEVSKADETGNLFYQKDLHLATLTYNAYENAYGTQRYGWSQLGINDLDSNGDYQILSAALYDVHELTNASSADKLKISVKLLQKTDDGDYVDVSEHLSSYLNSITVSPKGNPTVISTAAASVRYGAAEFRIADTGFNSSVPIEIDVDMDVITGAAFEKVGLTYANYKLVLKAELLQGSKTIEGSPAEDYIIYTNAKIIPTLVS